MSKKEIPNELQNRLDEFQVDVPDFPSKRKKLDRLANWIYAPAKSPIDLFSIKGNSITQLVFYPLLFLLVVLFTPFFMI